MTTTTTTKTARAPEVPGATSTYDVASREHGAAACHCFADGRGGIEPVATSWLTELSSHTIRGRSEAKWTILPEVSLTVHADDPHRLIEEVVGPVDLFASSAAANFLIGRQAPGDAPGSSPWNHLRPAGADELCRRAPNTTIQRSGWLDGALIVIVSHRGPFRTESGRAAAAIPRMSGMPTEE